MAHGHVAKGVHHALGCEDAAGGRQISQNRVRDRTTGCGVFVIHSVFAENWPTMAVGMILGSELHFRLSRTLSD